MFLFSYRYSVLFFIFLSFISCKEKKEDAYIPKPKGYNRIALPEHSYMQLAEKHPYHFEVSKWAKVVPDTFKLAGKHWIFIHYPTLKANIQLTYKPVEGSQKLLQTYIDDSYRLVTKHQVRASSIQEQRIISKTGQSVMLFKIEGDVPSPYQFYTTDSSKHFLRGAIYLPTAVKNDSLAPIVDYIHQDMMELLNTLKWQ